MRRVLILCADDWMARRAGAASHYLHEVGSRIAQEGNFVAWLCSNERSGPFLQKKQKAMESVDGIQIARLGPRFLYPKMVRIVLSRLRKQGKLARLYDVILNGVTGVPVDPGAEVEVPVVPVVFELSPKVRGTSEPPGPLVAVGEAAREALEAAGFPGSHVISAPFGAPSNGGANAAKRTEDAGGEAGRGTLVALTDRPGPVMAAVRSVDEAARPSRVLVVGRRRPAGVNGETVIWRRRIEPRKRAGFHASATYGYCGAGYEWEALGFGAADVPVICARSKPATEYVSHEETGLICPPRDSGALADSLARLGKDEVLRKRLVSRARERAEATTWDRTAGLVLAAIENLSQGS